MNRYDRGYGPGPSWADPYGGGPRGPHRDQQGDRPWVGSYREGYQGGSGGYRTSRRYGADYGRGRNRGYGGDYWWMGERAFPQPQSYDDAYERFDRENHPRYSPVGGMYHSMGGEYASRRPPRPLRDERWFSDWTRWF